MCMGLPFLYTPILRLNNQTEAILSTVRCIPIHNEDKVCRCETRQSPQIHVNLDISLESSCLPTATVAQASPLTSIKYLTYLVMR